MFMDLSAWMQVWAHRTVTLARDLTRMYAPSSAETVRPAKLRLTPAGLCLSVAGLCVAGALLATGQPIGIRWALLVLGSAFFSVAIAAMRTPCGSTTQPPARDQRTPRPVTKSHERSHDRAFVRVPADEVELRLGYGLGSRVMARVARHGGRMRIVCSIDESTAARHAAEIAGQLARRMRAELVYVHSETGDSSERVGARSHRRCDLLIVGFMARARFSSALLGEARRRLVRDAVDHHRV